jgi:hypothetical protein
MTNARNIGGAKSALNNYDPKSTQLIANLRSRHERELSNENFSGSATSNH